VCHRPGAGQRPAVLLLDEPFSAMDLPLRQGLGADWRRSSRSWACPPTSSPTIPADRCGWAPAWWCWKRGRVAAQGRPGAVLAGPAGAA
jgi:hypothetical protein